MNYYMSENGVIATIGTLEYPEISKEEFEAAMQKVEEISPEEQPADLEARVAQLEADRDAMVTSYRKGVDDAN